MKRPLILHITNNLRVVKAYLIAKYMLLTITTPILLSLYLRAHIITNGSIAPLVPYIMFIAIFWLTDRVVQSLFVVQYKSEEDEEHEQHTNTSGFKAPRNVVPITKARELHEQAKQNNNSTNKNDTGGRCGNSSGK
ncbi:hypothetical protein [Vibrio cholerae]|uniref:hypothetical protein n=1 Tax=Vibrio cholerae TaxID=666 RepID=UPI001113198D|nr:hypothetical protein [Vibrio cholerae]